MGDISIDNKTYRVNAKVFLEDSEFGIENGPVSKLWIADSNGNWIINYDRGWDVKPTAETEEIYNIALGAVRSFRNDNPYEPDQEESADVKHGALTEKMNESEDVDLNNEDLITGFVNVDIGEGNDAIHFIYNKDTQEVIYTKGYAAGRVHKKTTYSELPHEEFPYTTEGIIKAYIDTKLNTINESVEDEEDWSDPNYKVDTSNLYLTNYGYHNNSDIIYGRIHLLPKDKNSKLMPGHYDVIYYCENGEFQLFKLGTDVRTAVDYLYNYGSDEYDWVKWGGRRIQLDNIYEILTEEALKNVPQEQRDAIEKAINNAYYNEEPFPLNKVKYD